MTYDELDAASKDKALDRYRYADVEYDGWWDCVYEDAVLVLKFLGFDATRTEIVRPNRNHVAGLTREVPSIQFSGFYSQGDGASFTGKWRAEWVDLAGLFTHAPQDDDLKALGARVTAILLRWPLSRCTITQPGRASHSGSMSTGNADVDPEMDDDDDKDAANDALCEDMLSIARDAADWVYAQLQQEHEHLTCDDTVIERLKDMTFDEDDGYYAAETETEV